jgi:hypothetical protein
MGWVDRLIEPSERRTLGFISSPKFLDLKIMFGG